MALPAGVHQSAKSIICQLRLLGVHSTHRGSLYNICNGASSFSTSSQIISGSKKPNSIDVPQKIGERLLLSPLQQQQLLPSPNTNSTLCNVFSIIATFVAALPATSPPSRHARLGSGLVLLVGRLRPLGATTSIASSI